MLFPFILNTVITNETMILESIIHFDFEGLMRSPFAEDQLSILSKSQLIECKQETIFSLRALV